MSATREIFIRLLKGLAIGLGAIIPGVSGGTAAIITGVFEDILEATANFFKHIKKSLLILCPILFGVLLCVFICAEPFKTFCENNPSLSKTLFCVISLVSTLIFFKENFNFDFKLIKISYTIPGMILALFIGFLTRYSQSIFNDQSEIYLFLIGFPLSLALILPAVSFSYMLLFLGLYEKALNAISNLDFIFLIPLIMGILCGVFIFSKLFFRLISNFRKETYSFVLGFVICSIIDILV